MMTVEQALDEQMLNTSPSPFDLLLAVKAGLEDSFNAIARGRTERFPEKTYDLCKLLRQACARDEDASIGFALMASIIRYSVIHPVHVAIFCEIIGQQMELEDNDRIVLCAAALTSNIAMIELQEELYGHRGPISEARRQEVREHPARGVALLQSLGVSERKWLDAVLYHHETLDGSGYPEGLKGEAIPLLASLIHVADVYGAAISSRAYRPGLPPNKAIREIYQIGGKRIDSTLIKVFVKTIGVYPPGTFVRLANGEIAVVTHRGDKAHIPTVHSVVRENGQPYLSPVRRDSSRDEFAIKEIIMNEWVKSSVDKSQLWGYGNLWSMK